jgi:hypothetical protein
MSELDRRAAEAMGWICKEQYMGCPPEWKNWWELPEYAGDVMPESDWRPSTDLNQAAMVVAEVERRGLQRQWLWEIRQKYSGESTDAAGDYNEEYLFWLATAPASARVQAAITVLSEQPQQPQGKGE